MEYASDASYTRLSSYPFSRGVCKAVSSTKKAYAALQTWRFYSRQRRPLAEFDDRLLQDIGVSRVDVWAATTKSF